MRGGAVERELGADADADDHVTELVVQRVGEHAAHVVLDDRIEDREGGHRGADGDEQFGAGEAARQGVDGELGGERGEHHGAADGGLGVGVLHPVVEQREGGFDAEGQQDPRRAGGGIEPHELEAQRVGLVVVEQDPAQQDHAGADLHDQVAHPGAESALAAGGLVDATGPDQEHAAEGRELPEDEEGDQVASEGRGDGRARVDEGRDVLERLFDVECVETAEEGGDVEDDAEDAGEAVDADDLEVQAEEVGGGDVLELEEAKLSCRDEREREDIRTS